jgi:hypothetical protein
MKKITLLAAFALMTFAKSSAQVSSYSFSQSNGTYTEVTDGTVLGTATGNGIGLPSIDDVNYPVTLPFSFSYNGVAYNAVNVNSNGYITFGSTLPANNLYTPLSGTTAYDGAISAWGGDINAIFNLGGLTGDLSWKVVGTAPNRELVVQYRNFRPAYTTSTTQAPYINFQIRLFETSNEIRFIYGNSGMAIGTSETTTTKQIGLRGTANSDFINRTNPTTVLFAASLAGTVNTNTQAYSAVAPTPGAPSNGLTYSWMAPECLSPAILNVSAITPSSAVLTWNPVANGASAGYQYYYSDSGIAPTPNTGESGSVSAGVITTPISGLNPVTTYYAWVRSNCGGTFSAWSLVKTFTTLCVPANISASMGGSICGQGSATLGVTTDSGYQSWYAAETGGDVLGFGNTFNTPFIQATTNFYVSSETVSTTTLGVGAGASTTTDSPYDFANGGYGGMKGQYLFTAKELLVAGVRPGQITTLGVEFTSAGATLQQFTVQMGTTALTQFATPVNIAGGLTTVLATASISPTVGVNTLPLTTPFIWDGTSNIIISTSWSNANSSNTSSGIKYDSTADYMSQSYRKDNETAANLLAVTGTPTVGSLQRGQNRPKVIFGGQIATCVSPRIPVAATVVSAPNLALTTATASICAGSSATVALTAGTADYDTFVWTPATGVTGNAASGWVFTPASTTNYTLTASQSAGVMCASSANISIVVNPMPLPLTASASATAICANNVTLFTVTGGNIAKEGIIGTATTKTAPTAQPTAFCNRWGSYWSQTIYTAADLTAAGLTAGNITSLAYNVSSLGDAATNAEFTVSIGNVAGSVFANTTFLSTAGFTAVYGPATYTHTASGWNLIAFTTPFAWDGTSNIVINVTQKGANLTNNSETAFTATTESTTLWATSFTATTTTGTLSPNRLNIRLNELAPSEITWSPLTNLYTDNAATVPYTGTNAAAVYFKSATAGPASYVVAATSPQDCVATGNVDVNVTATPPPTGDATQSVTANSPTEATIEDLVAIGTDITWFASEADALMFANPLPAGTPVVNGETYYAVQMVDNCGSVSALAVTVNVTLGNDNFNISGLKYYPNPVSDVLTINYTQNISGVEVYNMLGQRIISMSVKAETASVKMMTLPAGAYIVQVKANDGQSKAIQVIKK